MASLLPELHPFFGTDKTQGAEVAGEKYESI
jgi:hypothetical protein